MSTDPLLPQLSAVGGLIVWLVLAALVFAFFVHLRRRRGELLDATAASEGRCRFAGATSATEPASSCGTERTHVAAAVVAAAVVAGVLEWGAAPAVGRTVEAAGRIEVAGEGPGVAVLWSQTTPEQGHRRFGTSGGMHRSGSGRRRRR